MRLSEANTVQLFLDIHVLVPEQGSDGYELEFDKTTNKYIARNWKDKHLKVTQKDRFVEPVKYAQFNQSCFPLPSVRTCTSERERI